MPIVAPEHRPTLREELAPLPARTRWAVLAVLGLLALALLVALTRGGERGRDADRARTPTVRLQPALSRTGSSGWTPAAGELLRLERQGLDSFVVEPLELPAYKGDVGGILPIVAARELDALKQRFPELEPVEEGKTRINQAAGYSLAFRVSRAARASTAACRCCRSPCPARATA